MILPPNSPRCLPISAMSTVMFQMFCWKKMPIIAIGILLILQTAFADGFDGIEWGSDDQKLFEKYGKRLTADPWLCSLNRNAMLRQDINCVVYELRDYPCGSKLCKASFYRNPNGKLTKITLTPMLATDQKQSETVIVAECRRLELFLSKLLPVRADLKKSWDKPLLPYYRESLSVWSANKTKAELVCDFNDREREGFVGIYFRQE